MKMGWNFHIWVGMYEKNMYEIFIFFAKNQFEIKQFVNINRHATY